MSPSKMRDWGLLAALSVLIIAALLRDPQLIPGIGSVLAASAAGNTHTLAVLPTTHVPGHPPEGAGVPPTGPMLASPGGEETGAPTRSVACDSITNAEALVGLYTLTCGSGAHYIVSPGTAVIIPTNGTATVEARDDGIYIVDDAGNAFRVIA